MAISSILMPFRDNRRHLIDDAYLNTITCLLAGGVTFYHLLRTGPQGH